METLPPYVVHQILKRSTFEDRLLTLQRVCVDWRRWTPLDDLRTLKVSDFERIRLDPSLWRHKSPSAAYFESNQKWLEALLDDVLARAGSGVKGIKFDSHWPRINDTPPLFCAPEGFKRWTVTAPMLELIQRRCGRKLNELNLTEENFVYTELAVDAYPILVSGAFPKLRRLAIARVDATFGPFLRQLSLKSLTISGENAPLDTAAPEQLKSLHLSHPFPAAYGKHAQFYLSRHFPNLESHSEQLLVEFEQLSETAQRKRLADYRQLPNFKRFRVQLGPDNGVRTEIPSISGYGLPKLRGPVNLQVRQLGDLAINARFLVRLRHVRVEGTLNYEDALALFSRLPDLEHLTLACHWISDEQHEQWLFQNATVQEDAKLPNASRLRNFRLTLWETAPKWLRSILKRVFGTASNLKSFQLQDYSEADGGELLLEDIGVNQVAQSLKQLNCRVGSSKTHRDQLESLLKVGWPKLSSFTWHATRLQFDHGLVSDIVRGFPNLKRFTVVPPSGPLRPLLPDVDDGLCHFESGALVQLIRSSAKLEQLRLFASSILDVDLVRAVACQSRLRTVKLWDGLLSSLSDLDSILDTFKTQTDDYRHQPTFFEIFTLRATSEEIPEKALRLNNNFFLANGRLNAIDEQSFYFP